MKIFLQPSYMFTDKEHRGPFAFSEELGNLSISTEPSDNVVTAQGVEANDKDLLLGFSEKEENVGSGNNGSAYDAPSYNTSTAGQLDLVSLDQPSTNTSASLAIDELLGLGMMSAAPTPAPPSNALLLNAKAAIDANAFQQKWRQLPVSISRVCHLCIS